jgi:hypothetical protein
VAAQQHHQPLNIWLLLAVVVALQMLLMEEFVVLVAGEQVGI